MVALAGCPVTFDDVSVGDELEFTRIHRGFVGYGEVRVHGGEVTKVTANTVEMRYRSPQGVLSPVAERVTRRSWTDACVHRSRGAEQKL